MMTRDIAAVVLAAGASLRLGVPKQSLLFGEETLLDRSVRIANEAGFAEVIVVLGAFAEQIRNVTNLQKCRVVVNQNWQSGMGASIATGIRALNHVQGAVVMTCDMPAVTPDHLRQLVASGELMASAYANHRGVPAFFPEPLFPTLLRLHQETGARDLLRSARAIELHGGELDVDTADDVERMQETRIGII